MADSIRQPHSSLVISVDLAPSPSSVRCVKRTRREAPVHRLGLDHRVVHPRGPTEDRDRQATPLVQRAQRCDRLGAHELDRLQLPDVEHQAGDAFLVETLDLVLQFRARPRVQAALEHQRVPPYRGCRVGDAGRDHRHLFERRDTVARRHRGGECEIALHLRKLLSKRLHPSYSGPGGHAPPRTFERPEGASPASRG